MLITEAMRSDHRRITPLPALVAVALAGICASLPVRAECTATSLRGTGDLGIVVERAIGRVQIVDSSQRKSLAAVEGLGDLSHASAVFSRDQRYVYVFGRDGGLTKVDLLCARIDRRIVQAGNSIGGAISQDGRVIAVGNYEPGGIRLFDAGSLEPLAEVPAVGADGKRSKVVGVVDAPDRRFVYSLYDAGEIWVVDATTPRKPAVTRFTDVGHLPYDGTVSSDGRYYIAGLFGENGLALLDLWHLEKGVKRILADYGPGEEKLPVYKMPHLDTWALAGGQAFAPAAGRHEVLVINQANWTIDARIAVAGQPVFVVARPDGRQLWVNFAPPDNQTVQIIDADSLRVVRTFQPGRAILHLEFTPRGEEVWLSARDDDRVLVYDTRTVEKLAEISADKPSGIFFSARANRIGM